MIEFRNNVDDEEGRLCNLKVTVHSSVLKAHGPFVGGFNYSQLYSSCSGFNILKGLEVENWFGSSIVCMQARDMRSSPRGELIMSGGGDCLGGTFDKIIVDFDEAYVAKYIEGLKFCHQLENLTKLQTV